MSDQRNNSGSRENRRTWIQRNSVLMTVLLITLVSLAGTAIGTWQKACSADELSQKNETKIATQEEFIDKIPVLQESLNRLDENFKDFRTEQRVFNRSIDGKLDRLLRKM